MKKSNRVRPPRWRSFVVIVSSLIAAAVYLFVRAPLPLDARPRDVPTIPIRTVFAMLELENDVARALWTEEIVNQGLTHGLVFNEAWRDDNVQAGPLPAMFLRETARNLERTSLRLSLFLGSLFPINAANQLTGQQASSFEELARDGTPQFFYEPATRLHTAMFADRAVAAVCVSCHNEHADSPKRDWQPNDIMGATTWMYPESAVTTERAFEMIATLRASIRAAYAAYLTKVGTFTRRPQVGDRWPKDGFYVPSEDAFMRELARRSSASTLQGLLEPGWAEATASLEPQLVKPRVVAPPASEPSKLPTLVIRGARTTRVIVEHAGSRVLVARVPAGGSTSLRSPPPLRLLIANPLGVEVEYAGKPIAVPTTQDENGDVEIVIGQLSAEKS